MICLPQAVCSLRLKYASLLLLTAMLLVAPSFAQTTVVVDQGEATWGFLDESSAAPSSATSEFVFGPDTPPSGAGSVRFALGANTDGVLVGTQNHAGLRLADITTLAYATYQNTSPQAAALQFNVDYDDSDATNSWQGRLVFEPATIGPVQANTWQTWNALNGTWWSTGTPVVGDVAAASPCTQATPCTWAQVLTNFPNIANQSGPLAGILLKAGSGWAGGWDGNADMLHIQTGSFNIIYDFESDGTPVELQSFTVE